MNATMEAAAQVIASADDLLSEVGRFSRDLYWDPTFPWNDYALVPAKAVDKLHESLDDYHGLRDLEDMEETEASFGADIKRQIIARER
jgi:hypothetical protein